MQQACCAKKNLTLHPYLRGRRLVLITKGRHGEQRVSETPSAHRVWGVHSAAPSTRFSKFFFRLAMKVRMHVADGGFLLDR